MAAQSSPWLPRIQSDWLKNDKLSKINKVDQNGRKRGAQVHVGACDPTDTPPKGKRFVSNALRRDSSGSLSGASGTSTGSLPLASSRASVSSSTSTAPSTPCRRMLDFDSESPKDVAQLRGPQLVSVT